MFFLVTHKWEKAVEPEAHRELKKVCTDAHYGNIGNPWPRLFYVWLDLKESTAFALWESSGAAPLEQLLARLELIQSEMVNVKQIFPPHIDLLHVTRFETGS